MTRMPTLIALHEGKTESVARSLIDMIETGSFMEGERLPSEKELSAQFGVAPVTLREALSILRMQGIIETRRGRSGGSFVCVRPATSYEELRTRLRTMRQLKFYEYIDEHIAISGAAAELAALGGDSDQHRRLDRLIADLGTARGFREMRHLDARFHIEVAGRSIRLRRHEARLQAENGELIWLPYMSAIDVYAMQMEHREILDAIVAREVNLAGALARQHLSKEIGRLLALKLEEVKEDDARGIPL